MIIMSEEKKATKKEISFEEILEALNTPKGKAALQAIGMNKEQPTKKSGGDEEEKEFDVEAPKIVIPEGATAEEMTKIFNDALGSVVAGIKAAHTSAKSSAVGEIRRRDQQAETAKVAKIRSQLGEELWFELMPVMNAQYKDSGDIEAAVKVAAKALGKENPLEAKETKKIETKEPKEKTPKISSIKSTESDPGVKMVDLSKVKPTTTKDAAKEALEEILAKRTDVVLDEEDVI